jgi:ParB-like chromosome segregation protein Spo0J
MRHPNNQEYNLIELPLSQIKVDVSAVLSASEKRELDVLSRALDNVKSRGPAVIHTRGNEAYLLSGRLQYELAKLLGLKTLLCAVFTSDVSQALLRLSAMFSSKKANSIEIADLIARLVESEGFTQSQTAELLGVQKSTVCQIYKLTALPDEVKADLRVEQKVTQSELIRISKLPADMQVLEYRLVKMHAAERGKGPGDEFKKLCELMVRTANKLTQFEARCASAKKSLSAAEKAQLLVAIRSLSHAQFNLKSFIITNPVKRVLGSFLRSFL